MLLLVSGGVQCFRAAGRIRATLVTILVIYVVGVLFGRRAFAFRLVTTLLATNSFVILPLLLSYAKVRP